MLRRNGVSRYKNDGNGGLEIDFGSEEVDEDEFGIDVSQLQVFESEDEVN